MEILVPYKEWLQITLAFWGIQFFVYGEKHRMILKTYRNAPDMLPFLAKINLTADSFDELVEKDMQQSYWKIRKRYLQSKRFAAK